MDPKQSQPNNIPQPPLPPVQVMPETQVTEPAAQVSQPAVIPSETVSPAQSGDSMSSKKSKFNIVMIVILIILVILTVSAIGYYFFLNSTKNNLVKVIPTPAVQAPTLTPTPTPEIDSKDTTDNSLNKDAATLDNNINSLDNDVKNVDTGFSDQQLILQ